jgi:hypothetical protein
MSADRREPIMHNDRTTVRASRSVARETRALPVRWGLIGCGDIARKRVAPALSESPHSELVAISRANRDLLDEFANRFGVPNKFADWRELVARNDIDAVYIATPVNLHAAQTVAAAESGKHVLCEKPMAMNVAECDRMITAVNASGVKLGIAYYRQFYPVVKRMKELVLNEGRLLIRTRDKERFEIHEPARNIHQPLIQDFVRAVIDERQPLITGDVGKAVAEVEEEIYRNGC